MAGFLRLWLSSLVVCACLATAKGEAMLELFQMRWADLTAKMPELAEAGYTSLWLPQPAKGSSVYSVGYDLWDPFDLGDKNQQGTIATKYGTKAELLQMVQTAHRFGIRVYFDNVMNHRSSAVLPAYNPSTPTNAIPGLTLQDFHLQTTSGGARNWPTVQDWNNQWDVQHEPINGLLDLATETGSINENFGPSLGSTTNKPVYVRHPSNPEYYLNPSAVSLGGPWHPFYITNGTPVADDVNSYEMRAVMWTLWTTKCDGFRMDAVKHVPSPFFGASSGNPQGDDPTFSGYTGAIQAIYDYTHGYGNNVTGNGYVETDGNRNSCFDTEATRNDAMLFGEHLGPPPSYQEYINNGMRLLNSPLRTVFNGALMGSASLPGGMDQRDFYPYGGTFTPVQGVQFAEDQDALLCCPAHREMQNAYYFMREGLPMMYSDGFNWAGNPNNAFPQVPTTAFYLGEYGDNTMPETCYIHHQMARGGTRSRWSDGAIVAFERYDYRDVSGDAYNNPDATVVLFAMNATYNNPSGDVLFDDGIQKADDGYYHCYNGAPSRGVGMVVGFPPGSVLSQMAGTSPGGGNGRTCAKLLVHYATTNSAAAQASANTNNAIYRLIYVNTLPPSGGGAIELLVPAGGWVMYGYQWPEPSRANTWSNAVAFRQGGVMAPTVKVFRHDGVNGDTNGFNPLYPFKYRGGMDPLGNIPRGTHVSNLTYSIDIPVLTNAPFDILVRSDASSANTLVKLDGGIDLNSQMLLGPTNVADTRDNKPGYASDVYLGYEQTAFQFRNGPEKFAARDTRSNNIVSLGAETYYYTPDGSSTIIPGAGNGVGISNQTATWVLHDPTNSVTATGATAASQRDPVNPTNNQPVDVWIKVGFQFQINTCFIYYTTDGSNPEGAYGAGKGTTQTIQVHFFNHDSVTNNIDWWKGTIPAQASGTQVRYKVALFNGGIQPISDGEYTGSKLYGLNQAAITNFNPTTALVWLHNDLNPANTVTGLQSGFHIVRARTFLPRSGKSAVYNTSLQTFYYDTPPGGVIAFPSTDGTTITSSSYQVVVRADSSVTEADYSITDANGTATGVATPWAPDATLSQSYPNYSQEFRFNYAPVASSGTATINVQLKTLASGVYTNRFTLLTRTAQANGPSTVVQFSSPAADNTVLVLNSNDIYTVQACFTSTLSTSVTNWNFYINGILQPSSGYIFRPVNQPGCPNMRSFYYNWSGMTSGTNLLQLIYNNGFTLTASRSVLVARIADPTDSDGDGVPNWMEVLAGTDPYDPNSFLRITQIVPGNPVELDWSSVSNHTYQILGTTNLTQPFTALPNALVPANPSGTVTTWLDSSPDATNKYYRVQLQY
ncbi:MAG: hypothetical protein C5B50_18580 [Verrucomicrobia bacterium]|nr:MAG: hypothetical protein C5B50_18580 [Verrucomicrobiota bacterium]